MGRAGTTGQDAIGAPAGGWWDDLARAVAAGDRRVTVEDAAGRRFVVLSEERYRELEEAGRRAAGTGAARASLTARELEVLRLVAAGHPGAVVAERLGLAPNTVAQHLTAVRRKYGVRSSAAAAAAAREDGLLG